MCLSKNKYLEKSYCVIYQGNISEQFKKNDITNYMILNERLAVVYTDEKFNSNKLSKIEGVAWYQESSPMSSLIEVGKGVDGGETVVSAAGTDFIENNPYITVNGEGVIIAIIDSGIDYLHPDFVGSDKKSKIISMWDQESSTGKPPKDMIFGSEFSNDDINKAIENNDASLSKDTIGTGTIASGIAVGGGNLNKLYKGAAPNAQLVVVKLREYEGTYDNGRINYISTDFLCAIKYVIDVSRKERKLVIINLTIGDRSRSIILTNLLDTFPELNSTGVVLISGAGNEGNTNIHYEGFFKNTSDPMDIIIEVGEQNCLDLIICPNGPDRLSAELISPSGELSYRVDYSPDNQVYEGKFNLENSFYYMRLLYPELLSGSEELYIRVNDIKPGIWTVRIFPDFIISGEFDMYLPNGNLTPINTRFLDSDSFSTITLYGTTENVITVGAFNDKTNSMWIGSSKGPIKSKSSVKPDIVAPGVDIISTYINNSYVKATGTGVSSSLTSGVLALIMEYIALQGPYQRKNLFTKVLKTYLMLGATKSPIYKFPNDSQGFGVLNLRATIEAIANKL